ncbi:MAG: TraR/DksA family transcriptional regulator [Deltaproteobacteria bacterium]|jgi:DnaK suppressor protein|nr:TraR/DksA family transcriptional regulator [Deltaproteobacteria bacterium]
MKSIKEVLIKMRDDLIRDITRRLKETSKNINEDIGDDVDSCFQERAREFDLLLSKREKEKLRLIEEALDKIEEGTYGTCEECGGKIPKGRLKAMPFALYCVDCKEMIEKEEKSRTEEPEETLRKISLIDYEEED